MAAHPSWGQISKIAQFGNPTNTLVTPFEDALGGDLYSYPSLLKPAPNIDQELAPRLILQTPPSGVPLDPFFGQKPSDGLVVGDDDPFGMERTVPTDPDISPSDVLHGFPLSLPPPPTDLHSLQTMMGMAPPAFVPPADISSKGLVLKSRKRSRNRKYERSYEHEEDIVPSPRKRPKYSQEEEEDEEYVPETVRYSDSSEESDSDGRVGTTRARTRQQRRKKNKPRKLGPLMVPKLDTVDILAVKRDSPELYAGLQTSHVLQTHDGISYQIIHGMGKYKDVQAVVNIIQTQIPNIPRKETNSLLRQNRRTLVVCAKEVGTGRVVGGILYKKHRTFMEVLLLAVDSQAGGRGIGSCLMDIVKEQAPRNVYAIFLDSDLRAIEFYVKHGFTTDITIPAVCTEPGKDQVIWPTSNSVPMECRRVGGRFLRREEIKEQRARDGKMMLEMGALLERKMRYTES